MSWIDRRSFARHGPNALVVTPDPKPVVPARKPQAIVVAPVADRRRLLRTAAVAAVLVVPVRHPTSAPARVPLHTINVSAVAHDRRMAVRAPVVVVRPQAGAIIRSVRPAPITIAAAPRTDARTDPHRQFRAPVVVVAVPEAVLVTKPAPLALLTVTALPLDRRHTARTPTVVLRARLSASQALAPHRPAPITIATLGNAHLAQRRTAPVVVLAPVVRSAPQQGYAPRNPIVVVGASTRRARRITAVTLKAARAAPPSTNVLPLRAGTVADPGLAHRAGVVTDPSLRAAL